ncbi:replication protein [Shewanella baltica]|uniref:replication protein n=1 Tax=Shewanella baltica TaxID=62322 RepID=UPI00217E6105|nr:replication protein [Shewanella baltica]MCS6259850.1 replication protein [Shewanella baltica]
MLQESINSVNHDAGGSNVVPLRPVAEHKQQARGGVVKADLDDGYLRLSNTLVDALCRTKLSDRESRVVFAVIRRTYGYGKATDWVSYSQIEEMTEIDTDNVSRVVGGLLKRNVLVKDGKKIGVNPTVSSWADKPTKAKTVSSDSENNLSILTVKTVYSDGETVGTDSKTCLDRPPQKKDINTKDNTKNICPKSAFNPFFKLYPVHRKGGSDSAAWSAWKSEKLTEADCEAAILWLTQAVASDSSWQAEANGQYVLGITKFIRQHHWKTPLPRPAASHFDIAVHSNANDRFDSVADAFNTEL